MFFKNNMQPRVRVSCCHQHDAALNTVTQSPFPPTPVLFPVAGSEVWDLSPGLSCHQSSGDDLDSAHRTWNEIWKTEGSVAADPWLSDPAFGNIGQLLRKESPTAPWPLVQAKELKPPGLKGVPVHTSAFLALPGHFHKHPEKFWILHGLDSEHWRHNQIFTQES